MAIFYPLFVRRSDGKRFTIAQGKKEPNEPSDEQLDQNPDKNGVSDYYREVLPEGTKHIDWRRKLGGMLAREMEWKEKPGNENYHLFEHVKKTIKDGKTEVKNKTHAAGGNDRQDAYLYGHPQGRRKRYRSPVDFFPHLLWLCTDESGNPDNCTCRVCCPEEMDSIIPGAKTKVAKQEAESKLSTNRPSSVQTQPQIVKQDQPASAPQKPTAAAARELAPPASARLAPTLLPQPRLADQKIDWGWNHFMYRPGELVWFKNGGAWSLGVVLRRWVHAANGFFYTVQQLSVPSRYSPVVTKSSDHEMRPWLAWSVPRYTQDGLNNLKQDPMRYETADWAGMAQKRYGSGNVDVDASILAAKSIDQSYSPFSLIETHDAEGGITQSNYDGVYFGAEKIWVGDPVRLVNDQSTDIMVVHSIVDRSKHTTHLGRSLVQHALFFIGDVYTLIPTPHNDPSKPSLAAPSNNPRLPQRLNKDLAERNSYSISIKHQASFWKLLAVATQRDSNEVKGRWYEASLLLPVLRSPAEYDQMKRMGDIQEATFFMNARGDCVNSNRTENDPKIPRQNIYRETRLEAFGRAVPPGTQIGDGINPPVPENMDPALVAGNINNSMDVDTIDPKWDSAESVTQQLQHQQSQPQRPQQPQQGAGDDVDMNNLVNFDDELAGLGQGYGSQLNNSGFY
nr:uncharacterized protein LOC112019581 [Quercus suber]